MNLLLVGAGLLLLIAGAEWLVRGAARAAAALGIPPLVVGLTVVAFCTSAPELAIGTKAALAGNPQIVVGNVVGSCILNVLFILGISAVITPLQVARRIVRLDLLIMIAVSVLLLALSKDGGLGRSDGILLVAGAVAYTILQIVLARREQAKPADMWAGRVVPGRYRRAAWFARQAGLVIAGLCALGLGSKWMVSGAVGIAQHLGISNLVIGLTVVTFGTTMPEAVTAVVASLRGQRDIAVGNVVGSNIFNILAVMGSAAFIAPAGIEVPPAALHFDMPVMVAAAVACLPVFLHGYCVYRWEGAMLFGYYIAYTAYLVIATGHHDALSAFSHIMMWFVVPLTAAALVAIILRTIALHRRETRASRAE
jgi:cation:H+ antiporter